MGKVFDLEQYAAKAREAMAEGVVLLQNDNQALPLARGSKVALFGRSQYNYYKSGTGSGGMVNTAYVTGVKEAIEASQAYELNAFLKDTYDAWALQHPYDMGKGWGAEPWYQEEMEITPEIAAKAAEDSDAAIILIGRTAGEDRDNAPEAGSYYLTDMEKEMIQNVTSAFDRTIVLLNVGNIIDMNWVEEYDPSAVCYIWQGGQEGGNGVLDVLDGTVSPSGKLTDTIAYRVEDYPAYGHYGDPDNNIYAEDIYVGYRYFETFAPECVQYPFGFGLSYTTFEIEASDADAQEITGEDTVRSAGAEEDAEIRIENVVVMGATVKVTNTGKVSGKEVVQVYVKAPQGNLGKAALSLVGYAKTETLAPGESEDVTVTFTPYTFASYDDSGITGNKSCYVLEAGSYEFLAGSSCRDLIPVLRLDLPETVVLEQRSEIMAPVEAYEILTTGAANDDGTYEKAERSVSVKTTSRMERRAAALPADLPYTGDLGFKLWDVADGKISMETFLAQLSDEDLCAITRGEGMSSPKVTPGTGGAIGGVTESLVSFGIPTTCCSDGPSGIRMDCGTNAFAMPNGTALACSFNDELVEELYQWEGLELRKDHIEALLGPGMNLHRYPMNGRNFEYFSEDPLVTGKMAAAQLRGMHRYGTTGVIKHFALNNQEYRRSFTNNIASERAIRELYLKGYEIAVKEGDADAVMTTYGPVNSQYTAGNYDLVTEVLRGEWGFTGIAMTDWWTQVNDCEREDEVKQSRQNCAAMIRAQNDLYMVVNNAGTNSNNDNLAQAITEGKLTRGELARSAANICRFCIDTPAYLRLRGAETELDLALAEEEKQSDTSFLNVIPVTMDEKGCTISADLINTQRGRSTTFQLAGTRSGICTLRFEARVLSDNVLSQVPMTIFQDGRMIKMFALSGADSDWKMYETDLDGFFNPNFFLKFYFGQSGMELRNVNAAFDDEKSAVFLEHVMKFFSGEMS